MKPLYQYLKEILFTLTFLNVIQVNAQLKPNIISIGNINVKAGDSDTILGSNFNTTYSTLNKVFYNKIPAQVISNTSNQMIVKVPNGITLGKISVITSDLSSYSNLNFNPIFNNGGNITKNSLHEKVDFNLSNSAINAFEVGDFDNNGKNEIAYFKNNTLNITGVDYSSKNGFTYHQLHTSAISLNPNQIESFDMNNDGKLDIVYSSSNSNNFIVKANNSENNTISFSYPISYGNGSSGKTLFCIGDINNDGKPDIITTQNTLPLSGTLTFSIYINASNVNSSIFAPALVFGFTGLSATSLQIACDDVDNDGKLDILINNGSLYVFKNTSNSSIFSFANPINFNTQNDFALGDLDGDGRNDLAFSGTSGLSILRNMGINNSIGLNSFSKTNFNYPNLPNSLIISDVNGDGKPDLVSQKNTNEQIVMIQNNSSTTNISFLNPQIKNLATNSNSILKCIDFNEDGKPDYLSVNQNLGIGSITVNKSGELNILSLKNPIIKRNDSLQLSYSTNYNFAVNNIISIELSDTSGSFQNATTIGNFNINNSEATLSTILPKNIANYAKYKVRITSSSPQMISEGVKLSIADQLQVSSISPNIAMVGKDIIINGNNFNPDPKLNTVFFGAVKANYIVSASQNQLKVRVPINAGCSKISVTCNGYTAYSPQIFTPTSASTGNLTASMFSNSYTTTLQSGNKNIDLGDLNNDGFPDLLISNSGSSDKCNSIYLNNGSKTATAFIDTLRFSANSPINYSILADVDGDGNKDFVFINNSNQIGFIRNNGISNTINNSILLGSGNTNTTNLNSADINNDGKIDFVISGNNSFSVFINKNSPGQIISNSFTRFDFTVNSLIIIKDIQINDLNGDQLPEILVNNSFSPNFVLLKNTSTNNAISFANPEFFNCIGNTNVLTCTDLNQDGKLDIIAVSNDSNYIQIFENQSQGNLLNQNIFGSRIDISTNQAYPKNITWADMDGDGKIDLVLHNWMFSKISIYKNAYTSGPISASIFQNIIEFPYIPDFLSFAINDINADEKPDIIVLSKNNLNTHFLTVYKNNSPNLSLDFTSHTICNKLNSVFKYTTNQTFNSGNTFTLQMSDSNGSFQNPINIRTKTGLSSDTMNIKLNSAVVGFGFRFRVVSSNPIIISNDNKNDVEIANCPELNSIFPTSSFPDSLVRLRGSSFSNIVSKNQVYFGSNQAKVVSATDSTLDVIVPKGANYKPVTVTVNNKQTNGTNFFNTNFIGGGIGLDSIKSFAPIVHYPLNTIGKSEIADLNADGKTDIIFHNSNNVFIYLNNHIGHGRFNDASFKLNQTIKDFGATINSLNVCDMNNDGFYDIITWNYYPSGVNIFINKGNGSFQEEPIFIKTAFTLTGAVGDMDKDGKVDLVGYNNFQLSIIKNNSIGNILLPEHFNESYEFNFPGIYLPEILLIDCNKDGYLDVFNKYNQGLRYLLNSQKPIGPYLFSTFSNNTNFFEFGYKWSFYQSGSDLKEVGFLFNRNSSPFLGNGIINCIPNINNSNSCFDFGAYVGLVNASNPEFIAVNLGGASSLQAITIGSVNNHLRILVYGEKLNISGQKNIQFSLGNGEITGKINAADFDNDGRIDFLFPNTITNGFSILKNEIRSMFVEPDTSVIYYTGNTYNQKFFAPPGSYFKGNNEFILEVSDSSGKFQNPLELGRIQSTGNVSQFDSTVLYNIQSKIPGNLPSGDNYKLRIKSTNSAFTSEPSTFNFKIRSKAFIQDIEPKYGVPGNPLYIFGSNFSMLPDSFYVLFGITKGIILKKLDTLIIAEIPHGATLGSIQIIAPNMRLQSGQFFNPTFKGLDINIDFNGTPAALAINNSYTISDINSDKKLDVLFTNSNDIGYYKNNLQTNSNFSFIFFNNSNLINSSASYSKIYYVDINQDGKIDLIGTNPLNKTINIFTNISRNDTLTFQSNPLVLTTDTMPDNICFEDMNNDGKIDIINGSIGKTYMEIYYNISNSSSNILINPISTKVNLSTKSISQLRIEDLDGDNKPEIIFTKRLASGSAAGLVVLKNINNKTGFNFFKIAEYDLSSNNTSGLEIGDINGDGLKDIITAVNQNSFFFFLSNINKNNVLTFTSDVRNISGYQVSEFTIGDLNGDNLNDIVIASSLSHQKTLRCLRNLSAQNNFYFQIDPVTLSTGINNGTNLKIADFNNDGIPDVSASGIVEARIFKNLNKIKKPTLAATKLFLSKNSDSILNVAITRGNGDKCLVLARLGGPVNSNPIDSVSYIASSSFGQGSQIGSGNYVVYNGPLSQFKLSNIANSNTYHFKVFEYNGFEGNFRYLTAQTLEGSTLNNQISGSQTICKNYIPGAFSGSIPNGGNGQFLINWLKSTKGESGPYSLAEGLNDSVFYQALPNDSLVWYKRIVISLKTIDSSNSIFINRFNLNVNFNINKPNQCFTGNQFAFTDISNPNKPIINRFWNFGEGVSDTSSMVNKTKNYSSTGVYLVKLILTDSIGCKDSIVKTIKVLNQPNVNFKINSLKQCLANNLYVFSDSSLNSTGSRIWKINENKEDTQFSFSKTFGLSGNYSVKLIASNDGCLDSTNKTIEVIQSPVAKISLKSNSNCFKNNSFQLIDSSIQASKILWNFGEGINDTSSQKSILKSFGTPGIYKIKLLVSNQTCSDSAIKEIEVIQSPMAGFKYVSNSFCEKSNLISFYDTSMFGINRKWSFGETNSDTSILQNPSKTYNTSGTFTIKLKVNNNECNDSLIKTIVIKSKPKASFGINSSSQCERNLISFIDSSQVLNGVLTHLWYLGNGETSTLKNPTYTYNSAGTYQVKLISLNGTDCKDSITKSIQIFTKPKVGFTINQSQQCLNNNVFQLLDTTANSSQLKHTWLFGDNSSIESINALKTYNLPGNFVVKKIVSNNFNCSDTASLNVVVHPKPATSAISGEADVFRNDSKIYSVNQNFGSSYQWFFEKGIGNKTGNSTSILWQFIGNDEIKLIETGIGNCNGDTVKLVVNIKTPVGINELNKNQFISIYPNPNSGRFYISDLNNINSIEVYDNQGKLVESINKIKHQGEINLNENLKSGLYFLRINTLESVYYSKIEVIR